MDTTSQISLIPVVENPLNSDPKESGEQVFSGIVEEYQGPIFNLCYRMLGDRQEAEDAAQETFVRAYLHAGRYDSTRSLKTWLFSIAHHYCIDQLRKRRRIAWISLDDFESYWPAPDHSSTSPEGALFRREDQRYLRELLAGIKPELRDAIVLRYWFDLSIQEIAQVSSCSTSAIKSRLFRARKELAALHVSSRDRTPIGRQAVLIS